MKALTIKDEVQKIRDGNSGFDDLLKQLENIGAVYIFGGFVRDNFIGRPWKDIDIVVDMCSPERLAELADSKVVTEAAGSNRFGGYKFTCGNLKVDVWVASETYAFTQGWVKFDNNIMNILDSVFFDIDAILYKVATDKAYFKSNYISNMLDKKIDMVLETNISPENMVEKALKWKAEGYTLSDKLEAYIEKQKGEKK